MNQLALGKLYDLLGALSKDERLLRLKQDEAAMVADPKVAPLLETMKKKQESYLTLRLECGENDEATLQARREFYEAKLALDEEEGVAAYRHSYAAVSELYRQVDAIVFGPYRKNPVCEERHASR